MYVDKEGTEFSGALCTVTFVNSEKPAIVSVIPTPTEARRVFVDGDRVYAVEQERVSIYSRKNPAAPKPASVIPVAATNIVVRGGLGYLVGGEYNGDREVGWLQIYDLAGGPPRLLGRVDLPEWACGLCVDAGYAFVADGEKGLVVVNVVNPARPSVLATVMKPGLHYPFAYGIAVQGKYGYLALAEAVPGGAYRGILQIVDLTDPKRPALRGSVVTTQFGAEPEVVDVAVGQNCVYLADVDGLHAIDVAEPNKPRIINTVPIKGMGIPRGLYVSGGKAHVAYYLMDNSLSGRTTMGCGLQIIGLAE